MMPLSWWYDHYHLDTAHTSIERIPRKWGVSERDTLEAAAAAATSSTWPAAPFPRIPKRWCGYDWCDALIYPFISDLSHWCGGVGVRNSYHPTKSHVVGAFSRSWWEQKKKECTTITYSNSTFVFEAFCSLESWHQNGRQLIMIHDWKHTHILKIKFQLVVTVMLVVLATYNNKRQKRVTLVRIPRIAVRLNKLNFVGEWRLITFPARSSFPTSTLEIVKIWKLWLTCFFHFTNKKGCPLFKSY